MQVEVVKFISMLVQHSGPDIKPRTTVILRGLFSTVKSERNVARRKAFPVALGRIANTPLGSKYGSYSSMQLQCTTLRTTIISW
jgi:hypothetical protein